MSGQIPAGRQRRVLRSGSPIPRTNKLVEEFNAARDTEYAEVLERIPALRKELAHKRARGGATYAEVEESEADLERFRSWLAKTAARDNFELAGRSAARTAIDGRPPTGGLRTGRAARRSPRRPAANAAAATAGGGTQ